MIDFKARQQEVFYKNRQLHYDFRHAYTGGQIKFLILVNVMLTLYGLLANIFVGKYMTTNIHHVHIEYGVLAIEGAVFSVMSCVALFRKFFSSPFIRERYVECLIITGCLFYIAWGFLMMAFSIIEGRETNYLPVLMIYAVCAVFTYISLQHYVVMFVFCSMGGLIILKIFKTTAIDSALLFNVAIFEIIFLATGITKYYSAQKKFIADRNSNNLRDELEANNEELIAINDNLLTTTDRLKDAMERQKLFTASMNHELRSPLNGILGILQIVRDDDALSVENRENIETAISSSKTLLQIVNDLLDFSKMEAGEFTITKEHFNLKNVVSNIESSMKPLAIAKGLEFHPEITGDTPAEMTGDSVRIGQIITNIVSNGIKYTSEGYVKLKISVSEKDELIIVVKDSGQGIAKDAIADLFVPFKRINEQANKKIQGTGLGLNIVKNLVEAMDGTIDVESEVGKGSVFTVTIPVTDVDRKKTFDTLKEEKTLETKKEVIDLCGKTLLCIDDNKVNLAVFRGMFKGSNASIETVDNGKAALELLQNKKYDVVFLDHMMPEMDGLEVFAEHNKADDLNKETPFVMLTGNATAESEKEYLDLGLTAYLSKPIIKEELFEKIKTLV